MSPLADISNYCELSSTAPPRPTRKRSQLPGSQNTAGAARTIPLLPSRLRYRRPQPDGTRQMAFSIPAACQTKSSAIEIRPVLHCYSAHRSALMIPIETSIVYATKRETISETREEFLLYFVSLWYPNNFDAYGSFWRG